MTDTRSITKELIHFSLPLILSGLLQQLYSWADAFIVGHAGAAGETMLAAIGSVTTITNLLIQSIIGFTLGLSILAAQEYGRGSKERLGVVSAHFLPLLCAVYTVLAFLMISGVRPILQFMDTPAELLEYAVDYLRIILVGIPFLTIYNLFAALFRAVGDSKVAFYAVLLSSLLNVILDILLVLVFAFGVQGAAIVLRTVLEGTSDVTFCSAAGISTLGVRICGSYLLRPLLGSRAIAFAEGISWTVLLPLMIFRTLQTRKKLL